MAADIWWTAPAESAEGEVIMVSGRDDVESFRLSGNYPDRIELTWRYGQTGMPGEADAALMEQADEALRSALHKNKGAVLTGIYTGAGERNWVIYAKSTRIFQSIINKAWRELPLLPVSISAEKDPDWLEYLEMRELTYIDPSGD